MRRTIAVALSKGGVGKTTTSVNLAAGLARAGRRVLLVDCDVQGQVAASLGVNPSAGLAEVLGGAEPEQAIVEARDGLWLLAGGRALTGAKRDIARRNMAGERVLAEALEPATRGYDYVLFDAPPSLDVMTINLLFASDEVLAPCALEVLALRGLVDFQRTLGEVQRYKPELQLRYVLPTFYDRRVKKSDELLGQLRGYYGDQVCSPIRYNVRLSECAAFGQTIFEYSPRSAGAEDYERLAAEVMRGE